MAKSFIPAAAPKIDLTTIEFSLSDHVIVGEEYFVGTVIDTTAAPYSADGVTFPTDPKDGDTEAGDDFTYVYDGSKGGWVVQSTAGGVSISKIVHLA